MADFYIKQGDTRPALEAVLMDAKGNPVDLTGATARLHLARNGKVVVDAPCIIVDAPAGLVRYQWAVGDTDQPGAYAAEIEVTDAGGGVETCPNNRHWLIEVVSDIA
ncbi:BppU family phage baseplate upper protein [Pukyongiella litopenaei]|uniref:DUF2479 domain-containing protein n=1 Tax=Pukyongiella litopenaei TaxID=2605946 RepID=A0A2S0MNE4_9RHOB|nr:BppU family phage baseplate upper protein [Pukyongiella litopenaei]AVO37398.1 DUF2479 domain-containing protein [Pukyongiella litopenaei]